MLISFLEIDAFQSLVFPFLKVSAATCLLSHFTEDPQSCGGLTKKACIPSLAGKVTNCCSAVTDDLNLEQKDLCKTMSDASFLIQRPAKPNPQEVKTEKKVRASVYMYVSLCCLYLMTLGTTSGP